MFSDPIHLIAIEFQPLLGSLQAVSQVLIGHHFIVPGYQSERKKMQFFCSPLAAKGGCRK
jgi:hypothetical protein